jgi:hypothetical protein
MTPSLVHTRKITFEVYDEHPKVGSYCTFANDTVEKTDASTLDFIYVEEIRNINGDEYVISNDSYVPVKLIYCWKIMMTIHD